ncbi:MAG: hypothetical protein WAO51_07805 [Bacillota bacterium]|jgi:Zn-dependent peptidase ImmA (M78 family)
MYQRNWAWGLLLYTMRHLHAVSCQAETHMRNSCQSSAFIDNFEPNDLASEVELEADRFAADILVPPTEYRKFTEGIQGGRISRNKVSAFAKSIGVAPGIVVGRLQHDGLLPYTHLNGLKVRLKWPT